MSLVLPHLVQQRVNSLHENRFQEFVESLYILHYGSAFTPIKQKRDKGCDGIINSPKTVIAIYGPERRDLRKFKEKVGDDFKKYEDYWMAEYPNWQVIYNLQYTSGEVEYLVSLKSNVEKIEPRHLVDIFQHLRWTDKRRIAAQLGIDDIYLNKDLVETVLTDLIESSEVLDDNDRVHTKPIYIGEKIELNYSPQDVDSAKEEYENCLLYFGMLQQSLASCNETEQASLRSRIIQDYQRFNGSFSQRLQSMTEAYAKNNRVDDIYVFFIRVTLIYFFEQCLIGTKTETEKK